jgi:hypothetical protein
LLPRGVKCASIKSPRIRECVVKPGNSYRKKVPRLSQKIFAAFGGKTK